MILTIPQITFMPELTTIIISLTDCIIIPTLTQTIDRGITLIVATTTIIITGTVAYLCYVIEDPIITNLERMPKIKILHQDGTTHLEISKLVKKNQNFNFLSSFLSFF